MKQLQYSLSLFDWNWDWHVVYRKDHDEIIALVRTLEKERPPVPVNWDPKELLEFHLLSRNGLVDDYPDRAQGDEVMVPIADATGAEWRHLLEWSGSTGFMKAIAGPPRVNARFQRIVSPALKAILESFHLPPHEFIPASVRHDGTEEQRPYFFFHLIADYLTELEAAYWPVMECCVELNATRAILQHFPAGDAQSLDEAFALYRGWKDAGKAPKGQPISFTIPSLVYREPYDLVWSEGWMTLSDELATAIRSQLGEEYFGPWSGKPTFVGFDPERDPLPSGL
jgi:hypothetical protein